jgi:hypothetical protein
MKEIFSLFLNSNQQEREEMIEGKTFTLRGEAALGLVHSMTSFFKAGTELADEMKFLCSAGAQLLTAHLEVLTHPQVRNGRIEVEIMRTRDAKGELDSRRSRRERERQAPKFNNHARQEKLERKHQEIVEGKPTEVTKDLKTGTDNVLTTAPREKKGLTHRIDPTKLTETTQEAR